MNIPVAALAAKVWSVEQPGFGAGLRTVVRRLVVCFAFGLAAVTATAAASATTLYYRYTDENGVTVMDSRIPPEYVKNGYEVVTVNGQVLEAVPPAPSDEEAKKLAEERRKQAELAEWDAYLLRRYSSVADIEAAKRRKLASFDASLGILRGNAGGIESQIEDIQSRAADVERSGREVPATLVENLDKLHRQLEKTRRQIEQRLLDQKELEERFDREIERFAQIKPGN